MMVKSSSNFLIIFILSAHTLCSSGALVGFYSDARKPYSISSAAETISTLKLNKINPSQIRVLVEDFRGLDTNVTFDLYLTDKHSVLQSLKSHLSTNIPHANNFKKIIVSSTRTDLHEQQSLFTTLRSVHSLLESLHLKREVKVSVEFSLSFLENLNRKNEKHERDLSRICSFIYKIRSFVTIEGELNDRDRFIESVAERAKLAISALSCKNVSIALNIKNTVFSPQGLAKISCGISRLLDDRNPVDGIVLNQLFLEANLINNFKNQRELLSKETTEYDTNFPPTNTLPTNPTPTIVTVTPNPIPNLPANTFPMTNPVTTPTTVPMPVPVPATTPSTIPAPVSNPVTTPSTFPAPVSNPATTPSTIPAPVTNPPSTVPGLPAGGAPATGISPAGQSWCVARSGASEAAMQSALDYACGIGGADCVTIQMGGSCYNPNSLQSHASYAFNSYYQKNPVQTSCDFGGTAMVTTTNPSSGSCIFQSSMSASSGNTSPAIITPTPMPTTTTPAATAPPVFTAPPTPTVIPPTPILPTPMPQTPPSSGDTMPSYGTPPSVVNSSNPAFGDGPAGFNSTSTISPSGRIYPLLSHLILLVLVITGNLF
jgi:hypothetical protein